MRDILARAAAQLRAAGVPSPDNDARHLAASIFHIDRMRLVFADAPTDPAQLAAFDEAIARRARREPLQHILGLAPFGPLDLKVGPGVFIPRPETETLAELAAEEVRARRAHSSTPVRVVDACTGSGAIAAYVATTCPGIKVIGVEYSAAALEFARANTRDVRVDIIHGDACDAELIAAHLPEGTCDVFVSNPPYVPTDHEVDEETRHDPADAVFAADGGMAIIHRLIDVAATLLVDGGWCGLEHDDTTQELVVEAFRRSGAFTDITPVADLTGTPRFVTARRAR